MSTKKYSGIDSIHIKNFKSLGDIEVSFGDKRVLALRGLGESGKSSIIKALSCCLSNKDATKQKRYIRNGTKGFSIDVTLNDGTLIQRIKSDVDNIIAIKGQDVDYKATKIDRGGDLIEELYKVVGISCESETKEYLHYRSYSDLLLFVDSTGSTNFKVIRDILNLEELTQAIKNGNKSCKEKKGEVSNNLKLKTELLTELDEIKTVELSSLNNLIKRINKNTELLKELKAIKELALKVEQCKVRLEKFDANGYSELKSIQDKLSNFNTKYTNLKELKQLNKKVESTSNLLDKYKVINGINSIDMTTINKLYNLGDMLKIVNDLKNKGKYLRLYKTLDNVKSLEFKSLISLYELKDKSDNLNKTSKQLNDVTNELEQLKEDIKQSGYSYCTNCMTIYK